MNAAKSCPASKGRTAFTLLELLVVLSVLALGAMLLVPALARTQPNSQAARCLNNMRQLMAAVTMYTHENHDLFPPNPDDGNTQGGYNWVGGAVYGWMPNLGSSGSPDAGNPDLLLSSATSRLISYLRGNIGVFRCPCDPRIAQYGGSDPKRQGTFIPVVRSVGMNEGVGTVDPQFAAAGYDHSGVPNLKVNGPWLDGKHTHKADQPYATFGKTTDFKIVRPAEIWALVDEDPWTGNYAGIAVIAASPDTVDYPSALHNNASSFSFADGHVELHRWKSALWIHTATPVRAQFQAAAASGLGREDWFWWAYHATRNTGTGTVP
jgi:prepilin-type N-terminal cleavage/methylation domain-containing protein/prepilin-type processing-associated H-X9-DG protein